MTCGDSIPEDKRDNVLAMLMLLNVRVRCLVVPQDGDEADAIEEVGFDRCCLVNAGC